MPIYMLMAKYSPAALKGIVETGSDRSNRSGERGLDDGWVAPKNKAVAVGRMSHRTRQRPATQNGAPILVPYEG